MFECTKCTKTKEANKFYYRKDGYRIKVCKACKNELRQSYDVLGSMVSNAKQRATKAGREFELTRDFVVELNEKQEGKCALTGWDLDWTPSYTGKRVCPPRRASLDRIDSSKGYTLDNVQLVCDMANRVKSAYGQDEFIKMCRAITERYPSR